MPILVLLAVLLIRVGLGMYLAGLTRAKNSAAIVSRLICDLGIAALAFYLLGAAIFTQQHNRVFAMSFQHWFQSGLSESGLRVLIGLLYAIIASGIVVGAIGERSRFFVIVPVAAVLGGVVVPLLMFWSIVPSGWLSRLNVIDVSGAGWLHVVA